MAIATEKRHTQSRSEGDDYTAHSSLWRNALYWIFWWTALFCAIQFTEKPSSEWAQTSATTTRTILPPKSTTTNAETIQKTVELLQKKDFISTKGKTKPSNSVWKMKSFFFSAKVFLSFHELLFSLAYDSFKFSINFPRTDMSLKFVDIFNKKIKKEQKSDSLNSLVKCLIIKIRSVYCFDFNAYLTAAFSGCEQ